MAGATSAALPKGTSATTSPVAGFITGQVFAVQGIDPLAVNQHLVLHGASLLIMPPKPGPPSREEHRLPAAGGFLGSERES